MYTCGRMPDSNDDLNIKESGSATSDAQLCSSRLWIPSGPGDLSVCSFCSFLMMDSTLKSTLVSSQSKSVSESTSQTWLVLALSRRSFSKLVSWQPVPSCCLNLSTNAKEPFNRSWRRDRCVEVNESRLHQRILVQHSQRTV